MSLVLRALLHDLRQRFREAANADDALPMQQYMKSSMPFYGIKATPLRALESRVFAAHKIESTAALIATANALWDEAKYREERYAAIDLPTYRCFRALETLQCLPIYEKWIVEGAWWDFCDDISGNRIAALLNKYPSEMKPRLLRWAQSSNIWLRRAAIICQRNRGIEIDAHLLYACILPSIDSEEFFLRKGIGWALRARSYDAPQEVIAFVKEYGARLSALTKKEALKVIAKRGNIATH